MENQKLKLADLCIPNGIDMDFDDDESFFEIMPEHDYRLRNIFADEYQGDRPTLMIVAAPYEVRGVQVPGDKLPIFVMGMAQDEVLALPWTQDLLAELYQIVAGGEDTFGFKAA